MLLAYVEVDKKAYITMFPMEEGVHVDMESSEAQSHLSYTTFIMIGQDIKQTKKAMNLYD